MGAASYVTINSLRLDIDGFATVDDLTPLQNRGPSRGKNFVAQGVGGSIFRTKVISELPVLLQVVVFPEKSSAGVAHSEVRSGFQANYDEIYEACVVASRAALVPLVLTLDDGSTLSGSVECPRFEVGRYGSTRNVWSGPLEIVVPAGQLT